MKNLYLKLTFSVLNLCLLIVNAQSPELWCITQSGGVDGVGFFFITDGNGNNQSIALSFDNIFWSKSILHSIN